LKEKSLMTIQRLRRPRPHRPNGGHLVAALGLALMVAGCSDGGGGVASLGDGEASVDPASSQRAGAEAFYDCLREADMPVLLTPQENGGLAVDFDIETHDVLLSFPDGSGQHFAGKSGEFPAGVEDDFWRDHRAAYGLLLDGVDRTEEFAACHRESSYVDPAMLGNSRAEEEAQKQEIVESTNAWTACARENGLPEVADVKVVIDDFETMPAVEIPLATPVELLRSVLDACPNFDPEQEKRLLEADGDAAVEWVRPPSIYIEVPPGWTDSQTPTANPPGNDNPDISHYAELNNVLGEDSAAFWEEMGEGPVPVPAEDG
jgi:hypothetical protein